MIDQYNLTDTGNAKRLVSTHGDDIRYCPEMVGWYIFNGEIWKYDTSGQIYQCAKSTAKQFLLYAINVDDVDARKRLMSHAIKMESQISLKNMVESAQNEQGIPISINEFDKNRDILCVDNGIIDLKTSQLSNFDKSEYITKQISTKYNPNATCPIFEKFMNDIFADDAETIAFMKRYLGYSLTGNTNEQVFVLLEGSGANGKGTLIDTVMDVMGDYAKVTDPETIVQKKYERSSTNDLAALKGARFVTTSENEANQVLDEGRIKRITGQDKISCRFLYREYFEYIPEYNLALLTNHDIIIKAQDYSIWRRILKVHFSVTFEKDKMDMNLRDKLLSEKEGILRWLVDGAKEWYSTGLNVPESVKLATSEYKEELDTVGDFVELFCIKGDEYKVSSGDLYTMYKSWCKVSDIYPKATRGFARELSDRNFKSIKSNGIRYKLGIDLTNSHKYALTEAREYNNEKEISGSLGSYIRGFLKVSIECANREVTNKNDFNDPVRPPMPEKNDTNDPELQSPPKPSNTGNFNECNENNNNLKNTTNNSGMVKIKLLIPKSNFVIDGKQYNLQCDDIADVPRGRAEKMIVMNIASRVSGWATS